MADIGESVELVDELAMESTKGGVHPGWHKRAALSTLLMAVLATIGALLSGSTSAEAIMDRTQEIIEISILEGEEVEVAVLRAKHEILANLGEIPDPAELEEINAYEAQINELEKEAAVQEERIQFLSFPSLIFGVSVAILSIGITLVGMAVVIDMKILWYAGIVLGIVGAFGIGIGIYRMLV